MARTHGYLNSMNPNGRPVGLGRVAPSVRLARLSEPRANGCVEYAGHVSRDGYGRFSMSLSLDRRARTMPAHRAAWILAHGPIVGRKCVCHACDNRRCINVEHLFLGTHQENVADMIAKGRARPAAGARLPQSKLTDALVLWMREQRRAGRSYCSMAKDVGLSREAVRLACTGRSWRHVQSE